MRLGSPRPPAAARLPLETARILATVLLVSYHVIGGEPEAGLALDYPHPARIFVDFFRDLRMPVFAFIAGAVFALKPPDLAALPGFARGKVRRLLIPGAVAVGLSLAASSLAGEDPVEPWWSVLVFPYLHYWFLMSILLIFTVYAPLDALTRGAAAWPAFVATLAMGELGLRVTPNLFSINGALYLAPYFLFGVLFLRHAPRLSPRATTVALALALLGLALGTGASLQQLLTLGRFDTERQDLTSLAFGLGACTFLMLVLPRLRLLDRFGPFSYTIYLYHVFGTSLARRALHAAGVDEVGLHLAAGLAAGLGLPVLLHLAVSRSPILARLMLGLRPGSSRRADGLAAESRDAATPQT